MIFIEDIVDRFLDSRNEAYRLLFGSLAKVVAEVNGGIAYEVRVDAKPVSVIVQ